VEITGFRITYSFPDDILSFSGAQLHGGNHDREKRTITRNFNPTHKKIRGGTILSIAEFGTVAIAAGTGTIRITGTVTTTKGTFNIDSHLSVTIDRLLPTDPILVTHPPEPTAPVEPTPLPEPIEVVVGPTSNFAALAQPSVRLVYFLPNDRPARPERIEAFRQLIKDTQSFFADEMERHGYGRKTFRVETDTGGKPIVHRFNGRFNERHYYQRLTDKKVWEEFFQQVNDLQHVYLIAVDLSYESFNEGESGGLGGVIFRPSGEDRPSFSFGSAAVRHRDETSGEKVLGGSALMPASGDNFYDTRGFLHPLRLITHELAHAFGLDHDFSDPDSAVGGRGFRFSEDDTEWLSVSRFFNNNPVSENAPGNIQLISAPTYSPEGITLRFEVTDADGLHQAQLLVPEDGSWGPWKLIGSQALDGQTQRVEFLSSELTSAPERVMLQFMDDLGNITWATFLVDIASLLPRPKAVSIPDRNLAAAVRKALGLGSNARITDQAIKKLTTLDARESQIKNLTGLEHATQLTNLELYKNQIRNVSPLTGLTQLKRLGLDENQIRDFQPIKGLTQLEGLYIGGNQINNNGVELLTKFKQLKWLSLYRNQISDIKPLANLTKLEGLWLTHNQIRDVSPLAGLANLKTLHIENNSIRDIRPLVGLTQLTDLKLNGNPIHDMSPLRTLKQQNPKLKFDIEIPPLSAVVHLKAAQRPPIYWVGATTGTLHRLVGDEVENLVPTVKNATSLAVDMAGGQLYWTEKTGERRGRIRGANLDGTNVKLVKELTSVPYSIALDPVNEKLYVTNAWGKIQRLNVNGSNFQSNLITDLDTPRYLVLDVTGGKVYWTEATEVSGHIRRANLDGSSVQDVATDLGEPLNFTVATDKIYWTSGEKLQCAHLDGTNSEVLETLPIAPTSIAVDTAHNALYLTDPSGEIHRRDLNGSGSQSVVSGLVSPSNIVLGISAIPRVATDTPAPPVEPARDTAADVNQDQKVNKTDLLLVVTALGETPPANPNFDVNDDGTVNIADVLLVIEALDDPVAAAAPSLEEIGISLDPRLLTTHIDILRVESDGSMKYVQAIAFFQGLLDSIRPTETRLLANYPNPFNPETWIPYQLANSSDVRIAIYDARGTVVWRLDLGHQREGYYTSQSRAAYWDGRNELDEPVASGVYFYTLTVGEFTATRKMLIRK